MKLSWRGLLPVIVAAVDAAAPFIVPWSDQSYGPNGPWRAVTIFVGSAKQSIDVFPGARWASTILTSSLCENTTVSSTCDADAAGLYDVDASTSAINATDPDWASWKWDVDGMAELNIVSDTIALPGGPDVRNVSITAVHQAYQTYPDGENFPVNVGTLSLGAPDTHFNRGGVSMNYITNALYTSTGLSANDNIPSYSYGLHLGSAAMNIPGSLLLGGYDENRVLGDPSAQPFVPVGGDLDGGALTIKLQDISIAVDSGASPFDAPRLPGLLAQGNASMVSGPEIEVNPLRPYIYLPHSTCDAITAALPVVYNASLGLYLWNTSDARYEAIVSSPSYLAFTFDKNANNQQSLDINVPFALLNLTLEPPLVATPTPYLPLFPRDDSPLLGKAFLQAAFVGVNWGRGTGSGLWFLAQAPGPGLSTTPAVTAIDPDADALSGSASSWQQSWGGYWTPLPDSGNSSSSGSGGLSTGAKAGIGVGVGVAGVLLLAALFWVCCLRRRRRTPAAVPSPPYSPPQPPVDSHSPIPGWQELPTKDKPASPVEVPATPAPAPRYELG